MLSATIHRRWAREYLARAEQAPSRRRKLNYLRLAVANSVRAQNFESEVEIMLPWPLRAPWWPSHQSARRSQRWGDLGN
jgi:hypothetical protein